MTLQNAHNFAILPIREELCMNGGIYTEEKCCVCGSVLKDNHRDAVPRKTNVIEFKKEAK
jgi:hypothetical protein